MKQQEINFDGARALFGGYRRIDREQIENGLIVTAAVLAVGLTEASFRAYGGLVPLWGWAGSILLGVGIGCARFYLSGRKFGNSNSELTLRPEPVRIGLWSTQPVG
jgi:hypothetical protein